MKSYVFLKIFVISFLFTQGYVHLYCQSPVHNPQNDVPKSSEKPQKTEETKEHEKQTTNSGKEKKSSENFEDLLKKEMEGSESIQENKTSWFSQFLKTTFLLAIIIGIFYGILRIYRFRKQLQVNESEAVKILYQYPLMPGKYLQIVQISGKIYFLGVSDSGIQLISEIKDQDHYHRIQLDIEKENSLPQIDFLSELTKVIKEKINDKKKKNPQKEILASPFQNGDLNHSRNAVRNHINDLKNQKNSFLSDMQNAQKEKEGSHE